MLSDDNIEKLWVAINKGKFMFAGFNTFARSIEAAVLSTAGFGGLMLITLGDLWADQCECGERAEFGAAPCAGQMVAPRQCGLAGCFAISTFPLNSCRRTRNISHFWH